MPMISDAISAYRAAQMSTNSGSASGGSAQSGPSFGSLVKDAIQGAVDAGKQSEAASKQAVTGKADMTEVAQAVNNADITLQTVIAVRDKVVSAYQQILQMPM